MRLWRVETFMRKHRTRSTRWRGENSFGIKAGILFIALLSCSAAFVLLSAVAVSHAQSETASNGSIGGVTPQRTNAYDAQDINTTPTRLLWVSERLFTLRPYDYQKYENGPFKFEVPIPNYHRYSTPVLADGALYFSVYNGNGYIMALNARDGIVRQRYKVETPLSPLTVVSGVIYVGAGNGKFHAFDLSTARDKWTVENKEYGFDLSSPLVADGIVYIGGSKGTIGNSSRPVGILYAVEASTGKELWSMKIKGHPTGAAAIGGTVYFGDDDKHLFAIDGRTGQEKWKIKTSSNIYAPAIMNEAVFFGDYDGNLYAVDLKTGQQKWKAKKSGKVGTLLALDKNSVYFGGLDNNVYAIDAATGQEKWRFKTDKGCGNPVLTERTVYFGCFNKVLHAVDAATGQEKWQYKNFQPIAGHPIIADGTIYFLDIAAYLHALK